MMQFGRRIEERQDRVMGAVLNGLEKQKVKGNVFGTG